MAESSILDFLPIDRWVSDIGRWYRGHTTGGREKELQRLDRIPPPEFRPTGAAQGALLPRCFGPRNRVEGHVVWISEPRDTPPSQGGGQWLRDVDAVVLASSGVISDIDEIWTSDGKVMFKKASAISETGVTDFKVTEFEYNGKRLARLDLFLPNVDMSKLVIGEDVTFTGFTSATRYNASFTVAWAKDFGSGGFAGNDTAGSPQTWRAIIWLSLPDGFDWVDGRVAAADPSQGTITIAQTIPFFRSGTAGGFDVFTGESTQVLAGTPPFAYGGGVATSDLRGVSGVLITSLRLNFFGLGNFPTLNMNVVESSSTTTGDIISKLMSESGVPSEFYDTSALTAVVQGFTVRGNVLFGSMINELMDAFEIVVQNRNGVETFVTRSSLSAITILASDLGARTHAESDDRVEEINILLPDSEINTPREVLIGFPDINQDLQPGSVLARRNQVDVGFGPPRVPSTEDVLRVDFNITMDAVDARAIAERIVHEVNQPGTVKLRLPPSFTARVLESERLSITTSKHTYNVEVEDVTKGLNGMLEVAGHPLQRQVLTQTALAQSLLGPGNNDIVLHPGATAIVLDLPLLARQARPRGNERVFLRLAQAGGRQVDWVGADLYYSTDGGTTYKLLRESPGTVPEQHTIGFVMGPKLPDGPVAYWDRKNTLDVALQSSNEADGTPGTSLEDQSRLEVLNGANTFAVGNEIIACQDVSDLGGNVWRLNGPLLRGLRGTESETGSHGDDEAVVLLAEPGRVTIGIWMDEQDIGLDLKFKAVPLGFAESDIDTGPALTFVGNSVRNFAVAQVEAVRDPVDNLTLSWFRRTRLFYRAVSEDIFPAQDIESYEVDVMSGATVLRTISVLIDDPVDSYGRQTGEAVLTKGIITYTADDQLADGLTPGASVEFNIYQVGPTVGRGRVKNVTV